MVDADFILSCIFTATGVVTSYDRSIINSSQTCTGHQTHQVKVIDKPLLALAPRLLCTTSVTVFIITFRVSRRRLEMYCGHARLCVCVCVCLSAAACLHHCTDPDVTWGVVGDAPYLCTMGGFTIGARVALLWQH